MIFDSKETEEFYYKKLKELRIGHVSLAKKTVYTMEDVIEIIDSLEECIFSMQFDQ